jgi:hypothetical protein
MLKTFLKTFFAGVLICSTWPTSGQAAGMDASLARDVVVHVDWQRPESLPPLFRNHCSFERFTGRPYCSDHCGGDYQFYFCSEASFGCCHLGHGYCGFDGVLRCHP